MAAWRLRRCGCGEALHARRRLHAGRRVRFWLSEQAAARGGGAEDVAEVSQKCHKDVAMVSRDVAEVSQKCHRFVANCHKMSQGVTAKDITGHQPPTASHAATSAASLAAA